MKPTSTFSVVWSSLIGLLLLLLLAFGLHRLWHTLRGSDPDGSHSWAHGYVAFALSFFVFYDLLVYHMVAQLFPYTSTAVGAGRFVLDIAMAFCIFTLLQRGMGKAVWTEGGALVATLVCWHLLAVLWYVMSHTEYSKPLDWRRNISPHLVFCVIYVGAYGIDRWVCRRYARDIVIQSRRFVLVLAALVIAVSLFRLYERWRKYQEQLHQPRSAAASWFGVRPRSA